MSNATSVDKEAEATQACLIAAGVLLVVVLIVALYLRGWSGRCCETGVAHVVQRCKKKKKWGYTWVDGDEKRIYLGTKPKTQEHVEQLKKECGIGGIVTLNQTWELFLTQEEVEAMGVKNIMLPTPDYVAPYQADILKGVQFMEETLATRKNVYVHCNAGKGRSATVVICYFIKHKELTPREAFDYVKEQAASRGRKIAKRMHNCGGCRAQWRSITTYHNNLQKEGQNQSAQSGGHARVHADIDLLQKPAA